MADRGVIGPGIRLDIQQLQIEAQHRWLRPAEICEILRNYQKFQISSEPANRPPSGSLFLFDRKVLRYFRKDGHNWRKKRDGKTIKEAHEKLKVGSVDVLHCYYAHGEENDCFQRRSYWLLEEEFMNIVFVHYLEVKGNRSTIRETEPAFSNSQLSNSRSSSVSTSYNEAFAGNAGSPSAVSSLTSSYEDIESEENHQAMSKNPSPHNFPYIEDSFEIKKMTSLVNPNFMPTYPDEYNGNQHSDPQLVYGSLSQSGSGLIDYNQFRTLDLASWEEVFNQCTQGSHPVMDSTLPVHTGTPEGYNGNFSQLLDLGMGVNHGLESALAPYDLQRSKASEPSGKEAQDDVNIPVTAKKPLLGSLKAEDGLQKVDSFSKWMTKELDGVEDLDLKSSSNLTWLNIETATSVEDPSAPLEDYSMSPSIGHDQLFDIHEFSPTCACTNSETKVVISGKFLVSPLKISNYNWSCMFGEVEVPAKVLRSDALCCYAPSHSAGRVPFYVTCSNRFACSQVREFDFIEESQNVDSITGVKEGQLLPRLRKLLSQKSLVNADSDVYTASKRPIVEKIRLLMEDELCVGVEPIMKDELLSWLVDKLNDEDGKGPNVLDEGGQGLLHLAAALGYDWIIRPILAAGVSVNFRDVNGWTALHWAACYGREKTVALLIALGAAPGALIDPSPEFPSGRPPADLASANGYKGISGYLAESALTDHLSSLTMADKKLDSSLEESIVKAVQTVKERVATPDYYGDGSDLSLKDSLAALRNATQAAGRIHQVFRMQSFQRKQVCDSTSDESLLEDERVLSLIASKMLRPGHLDEQVHSAAVQIQKKFRGWKKRKEFLIIRERVVKIQAHVRGHQVRKRYKTVVWSVGILEKVILRWRRKGTGLRGFRPDALNKVPTITQGNSSKDDDYDYLKKGRKQTEERLQKALVRVKSMVQYPEGRAQYRRLLTAVEGFQKNQLHAGNKMLGSSEMPVVEGEEEDLIDVDSLLDDDSFMAIAFE